MYICKAYSAPRVNPRSTTTGLLLLDSPSTEGIASWVNYSRQRTESSSEHFASDLSLLKADAPWCDGFEQITYGSEFPKASVLPTTPQHPTISLRVQYSHLNKIVICLNSFLQAQTKISFIFPSFSISFVQEILLVPLLLLFSWNF